MFLLSKFAVDKSVAGIKVHEWTVCNQSLITEKMDIFSEDFDFMSKRKMMPFQCVIMKGFVCKLVCFEEA